MLVGEMILGENEAKFKCYWWSFGEMADGAFHEKCLVRYHDGEWIDPATGKGFEETLEDRKNERDDDERWRCRDCE